jgi:lysophospholipase L1-like esterase
MLYAEGVLKNGWIEVALLSPILWFLLASRVPLLLHNCLLSLLTICLTVPGMDLLLRPVMERRLNYTPLNVYAHKLPRLPIVGRWDSNLVLDEDLYGDLSAISGDPALRESRRIIFKTDEAGFRNSFVPPKIEVLILGDSFAAGWGTTQEEIFSQLLSARYGQSTYNLAYPGGPYDQYVNFAIEWPRLTFASNKRMVWALYAGNDLDDAAGDTWDLDQLPWQSGLGEWVVQYRTFRNRSPLNRLMENMRRRWMQSERHTNEVVIRRLPSGQPILFRPKEENWSRRSQAEIEQLENFRKLERTLKAMRDLAAVRGIEVTLVVLPTKGDIYRWILDQRPARPEDEETSGFARAVLASCQRIKMQCIDTKPYLIEKARQLYTLTGALLWWRDDTHMNGNGHEAIATLVRRQILDEEAPQRP